MALEEYAGDMNMCCRCNACKFVPLQQVKGFKHANVCPSISQVQLPLLRGRRPAEHGRRRTRDEGFKYAPRYLDSIYNCQLCGACDVSCKYGMDMEVLRPIQEMRIKAVEDGHAHPALDKVVGRMRATGSMVPVEGASAATGPRVWDSPTPPSRRWTFSITWAASPATTRTCRRWPRPRPRSSRRPAWRSASPATPRPAAAAGPTRWATRRTSWPRRRRAWRSSSSPAPRPW